MDIRQCIRCRKIFQFRGNYKCPDCVREMDELFVKVRNYIYEHVNATMAEIVENTGAEEIDVDTWLREGRLILDKGSVPLINCESCGEPIVMGRYCDDCAVEMKNTLQSGADSVKVRIKSAEQTGHGYSARRKR